MKIHSTFLIIFAILLPHPLIMAKPGQPAGNRSFTYIPHPSAQHELLGSGQVMFNGRTTAIVNPFVLTTTMMVTPRTFNLSEAGQSFMQSPHVQIKLYIPPTSYSGTVRLTAFTLNGHPIAPIAVPYAPGLYTPPDNYRPTSDFVHLFFDRDAVLNILGPTPGDRNVLLQATLGDGNTVTSYDIVKLVTA